MRRSSANPEAGDVVAPEDAALADAVAHAVRLTWRVNPYYRLRFGERGWRFSLSDSGWMATLPGLGASHARGQLRWLHRVLANRGMPGWLLEEHLGVMQRVLDRRLPERADEWALFGAAREELAEQRRTVLGDAELDARSRAFAAQAGDADSAALQGAGRLLLGAWIDHELGMPKAIESMLAWLGDRERLPEDFCDLAEATVGL